MYQIENSRQVLERGREAGPGQLRTARIGGNVLLLGLVSFFTDISAEMVATILPLYLIYGVGLTPFLFGLIDGVYQGASSVARLAGGYFADRTRGHKQVAALGYGISAVSKLGLLFAGSWGSVAAVIGIDRAGKGIRTAPRDALISLSAPADSLGRAFGVHRALDTAGAMIGPLVAFGLLALATDAYDAVFVVSFLFGLVGLAIMLLFVRNRPVSVAREREPRLSLRRALRLLHVKRFRTLVAVGSLLGLATMSDGFVYLALQQRDVIPASSFPLLYVATAATYMVLAVPVGRLADAIGRHRIFLGGYALLLLAYTALLTGAPGVVVVPLVLLLFGTYYAATDGVLVALASACVPAEARATGIGVLTTAVSVARLVASIAVGAIWTWVGLEGALVVFTALLAAAIVLAVTVMPRSLREPSRA